LNLITPRVLLTFSLSLTSDRYIIYNKTYINCKNTFTLIDHNKRYKRLSCGRWVGGVWEVVLELKRFRQKRNTSHNISTAKKIIDCTNVLYSCYWFMIYNKIDSIIIVITRVTYYSFDVSQKCKLTQTNSINESIEENIKNYLQFKML